MADKLTTAGLLVVGAVSVVALVKPAPKEYVAASALEADVMATEIIKDAGVVALVRCCNKWVQPSGSTELVMRWLCDAGRGDYAPRADRVAWLEKQAALNPGTQCLTHDPVESDGAVTVLRRAERGPAPERPPTVDELMPKLVPEPAPVESPKDVEVPK